MEEQPVSVRKATQSETRKNVSYSIGLQRKFLDERGETKLTVFKETLTGEITAGPWPTFFPTNATGKSRRHGTEFDLSVGYEKLELHSNYTYVISRDANKNINFDARGTSFL